MDVWAAFSRAKRGFREHLRLNAFAVSGLVVAFLCLGATQLAVENLDNLSNRWGQSHHLTVYLKDAATEQDIAQLRLTLESLVEVEAVKHISAREAREQFAQQAGLQGDLSELPPDLLPASLEVALVRAVPQRRISSIAAQIKRFVGVESIETYRDWHMQLGSLLAASRWAAATLAVLVALAVMGVIGNTVRLAAAIRRQEIEVLKLCGATDGFVRAPFLLEGAIQGALAAFLAMLILLVAYAAFSGRFDSAFALLTGTQTAFLHPLTVLFTILGGGAVGALGSAIALRRYLMV